MMSPGPLGAQGDVETQRRLVRYLKSGRVHPALLWTGPDASVKREAAKGMAKGILCRARPETAAFCGTCSPCRRIDKGLHPDVLELTEPDSSVIKIETVRELCHQMQLSPIEGGAKVCLIDECHRMTPAAANAFLKALEEPGPKRFFLLLSTQPGALLPTVLSRCIQFHFRPTPSEAGPDRERFDAALEEFLVTKDTQAIRPFAEDKATGLSFLHHLQHRLRDAVITWTRGETPPGAWSRLGLYRCLDAFDETTRLEARLRSNANYALMLEVFLIERFAGIPRT